MDGPPAGHVHVGMKSLLPLCGTCTFEGRDSFWLHTVLLTNTKATLIFYWLKICLYLIYHDFIVQTINTAHSPNSLYEAPQTLQTLLCKAKCWQLSPLGPVLSCSTACMRCVFVHVYSLVVDIWL